MSIDQKVLDEIQLLALTDVKTLVEKYIDPAKLNKTLACNGRKSGKSLQQIAIALNVSKSLVYRICQAC